MAVIESLGGTLLFACGCLLYVTIWGYQRSNQWFNRFQLLLTALSLSLAGGGLTVGIDTGLGFGFVCTALAWSVIVAPGTPGYGGVTAGAAGYILAVSPTGSLLSKDTLTVSLDVGVGLIVLTATATVALAYIPVTRTTSSDYRLPFDQLIHTYYRGLSGIDSQPLLARHHFGIYIFGEWYAREIVYKRYAKHVQSQSDPTPDGPHDGPEETESGGNKNYGGTGGSGPDPYRVDAENAILKRHGHNAPRLILKDGTTIDLVIDEENPEESPYRARDMRPIADVLATGDHGPSNESDEELFKSALGGYGYRFDDSDYREFAEAAQGLSSDDIQSIADQCKREVQRTDSDLTKGQVLAKIDDRQAAKR